MQSLSFPNFWYRHHPLGIQAPKWPHYTITLSPADSSTKMPLPVIASFYSLITIYIHYYNSFLCSIPASPPTIS